MAATRPLRVSDLIKKYGWEIMPYLSNLGPTLLAEAQVLFVDSGATNALDADDGYHGHSFVNPLATWDYAIGLCTAGERSIIFLAPGHNDPLGDAQIDIDVADITTIGIGVGTNKPRIDFDHANSSVNIAANNTHIRNVTFMPSITDILIGVDVEAGVTGTIIEKCDFAEGEAAADEFILGVDIKAGCSSTKITNCLFRTIVNAAGCTHAVKLTGASDNVIIEKSRMIGNWSTAAIGGDTTLSTDLLIDDVTIKVKDGEPGIEMFTGTTGIIRNVCIESTGATIDSMIVADTMSWFNNFGVTADGASAELVGGGEVTAGMLAYNLDHLLKTSTGVAVDGELDSFVTALSVLGHIMATDADPSSYNCSTDSLQSIATAVGAITENVSSAVAEPPTAKSLHDTLHKDGSYTFDNTTDSLEMISDKLGAFAGTSGAGANESLKADVALIQVDLDAILEDSISISGGTLPDAPVEGSLARYVASGGTALGQPLPDSMSLVDVIGDFTGAHDGTAQDDNIKASLDLAHIDLDALLVDTDEVQKMAPRCIAKTVTNLSAASGNTNLFTISGGPVKITSIVGLVTNQIKATAIDCQIVGVPTAPGVEVDITAVVDINAAAIGTTLTPGATFGAAMVLTANGCIGDMGFDVIHGNGVIAMELSTNGDADDAIVWYIRYEPLVSGATIVAA